MENFMKCNEQKGQDTSSIIEGKRKFKEGQR